MRSYKLPIMFLLVVAGCGPLMKATGKKCLGELYLTEYVGLGERSNEVKGKTVNVCAYGRRTQVVAMTIPTDSRYDSMELSSYHELNEKGEVTYDGACDDNGRKKFESSTIAVALTADDFDKVKLCYYNAYRTKVAIVAADESCPAGTVEQSKPVTDCPNLIQ